MSGCAGQSGGTTVNGYSALAAAVAVGLVVGGGSAPITPSAHASVTLLSSDGPLAGSETAIILGGTTEPTPSPEFARAAEDLYLHPLGFDGGATDSLVCDMNGTDPCTAPLQVLTTPELIQQDNSTLTAASDIVLAVQNELAADPGAISPEHPLTIFAYSQSASAGSVAMTRLAEAGIPADDLHFVFIGDPNAPGGIAVDGGSSPLSQVTPDDLYPATIYSFDPDPVPNFAQVAAEHGQSIAFLEILGPHVEYLGLTPAEIANATTTIDGDLTYQHISDTGVNNVAAWLTAVFEHGAGNSGLFQSLLDSVELFLTNAF